MFFKTKCPYCNHSFTKKPVRSGTCKNCGNKYYVNKGKVITENYHFLLKLENMTYVYGVPWSDLEEIVEQWGIKKNFNDYLWSLMNKAILKEISENNNPEVLATFYYRLADIARRENKSDEPYIKKAEEYSNIQLERDLQNIK